MKRRTSRLLAALTAAALFAQSTGAASLPAGLMLPPAGRFLPPPARLAAMPGPAPAPAAAAPRRAAKPDGTSWLESARIVAAWLIEQATADPAPATAVAETVAPEVRPLLDASRQSTFVSAAPEEPAPVVTPLATGPADRMLVKMEPGERVEAAGIEAIAAMMGPMSRESMDARMPAFRDRALSAGGLRARLSYLKPHGVVRGEPGGFFAEMATGATHFAAQATMPPEYLRGFPVYYHDEAVTIEFQVVNETGRTLRGASLEAIQENFRVRGEGGERLSPPQWVEIGDLAPGQRKTVTWSTTLRGPTPRAVNLEQTHVRVFEGGASAPLMDEAQAGAVDPPGPGLL